MLIYAALWPFQAFNTKTSRLHVSAALSELGDDQHMNDREGERETERGGEARTRKCFFIGVHGSQRWGQGREPWVGGRRQIIRHVKHMYILERIKWSQKTLAQGTTNIGVSSLATLNKLISKPNTSLSAQNTMGMMTHCNEIRIHLHIKDRHLSG